MMTCDELDQCLGDLISWEGPREACRLAKEHLRVCPRCAAALDRYRRTIRLARQLPDLLPPARILDWLQDTVRWGPALHPE